MAKLNNTNSNNKGNLIKLKSNQSQKRKKTTKGTSSKKIKSLFDLRRVVPCASLKVLPVENNLKDLHDLCLYYPIDSMSGVVFDQV
jgi:hypothetical protein